MLTLFQITGSASFAARCALEELGVPYETVDVEPRHRDGPPEFLAASPTRRVPALRDGDATLHETGAVLLHLADRFPEADLGAPPDRPAERAALLRWLFWLADTLHPAWHAVSAPQLLTSDPHATAGVAARGREAITRHGALLEDALADGRPHLLGARYTVADTYLYMLTGWGSYADGVELGGAAVAAHFARVGARPAIRRARELDDLDERLQRHHPELRAGRPIRP